MSSNNSDYFKQKQPSAIKGSNIFDKVYESNGKQLDKLLSDKEDLILQLNPQTCTWSIDMWEDMCGIQHSSQSLNIRRSNVITKLSQLSPITRSRMENILKNYADDVQIDEYFSEYRFDVILKTKTTLHASIDYIMNQIEDLEPCHLAYQLITDYILSIIFNLKFSMWFSDILSKCGTFTTYEDGSKESKTPLITGWSFKDFINSSFKRYFSNRFMKASTSTFVAGNGYSILKVINENFSKYFSDNLMKTSESTFVAGNGYSVNKKIYSSIQRFFSEPFLIASENTFIYGQGNSYKGYIVENYKTYFSQRFKVCSENLYSEGGELIYDN
ncbi:putative phage tail protein [Clostridium tyrobutyricum]|uniref:putative phage tail protein n=1 Tax=Clostridium tyrobutyricum TaxID=1519 RepID=UPI002B20C514|nr:putative phage tail protein [Clostridium tyrobutyricum]MEA5008215.1 putative phage tail protein [Clostridium tyrobutyricum]